MTTGQVHGELWTRGARDWARFQEPHSRPLYEAAHETLGVGNGTRLLDVGCGTGGAALLATEKGARVAGLDASPGSVEVARERVPHGDFRVGDMESLPWPDDSFEVVTGFNSFQFAGSPLTAFKEVHLVLDPSGRLGIVVWAPSDQSEHTRIMEAISLLAPPQSADARGPFSLSTPGLLESLLASAGLKMLNAREIPVVFEYPDTEAACRALMAGSGAARAIQHSGPQVVRQTIVETLDAFRVEGGGYRIANRFRLVLAQRS